MRTYSLIFLLIASCSIAVHAQPGLIGYYSFCNCDANDNSGNGNHGTLIGNPACIAGQRGEGFLFNQNPGSNGCGQAGGECVQLPTLGAIWANGFSVCAWVRFDNESYYERIVDLGNSSGDSGGMPVWFGREGATNNLALESWISSDGLVNRSTGRLVATNVITNGSIEYYCATISGDTMRIYVNGILKAEKTGHPMLNVPRSNNFLGRSNWCSADPDFKGFMDEVRIYNRALDATEINALYLQTPTFAAYQTPVSPGVPVQLEAQGGIAYQWSPAGSLNNPSIPNPIATPFQTTTYTCKVTMPDGCMFTDSLTIEVLVSSCVSSCSGSLGENIFPDGDFGFGSANILPVDPGIAPGYQYTTNPPPGDGFYCITNNTSTWGLYAATDWVDIQDNGPETNGYMMVVNASNQPGLFYQKSVDVCENTLYEFSIDVISLLESHLAGLIQPNISFLIDGQALCETGNISADEQWRTVRFSFTTVPGQTTVSLGLRNNAPGGAGNDLAIDNISFRACGPTIQVPSVVSYCAGKSVLLNGILENSPYSNTVYQWQSYTNGSWQEIQNANNTSLAISNPVHGSQFRMVAANSDSNLSLPHCRVVSEPIKLELLPDLVVNTNVQDISCAGAANGTITLNAISGIAPYTYSWGTSTNTAVISNLGVGTYAVTVTDAKGCSFSAISQINEPEPLLLSIEGTNTSCKGAADGTVVTSVSGGITPYIFHWSNALSAQEINNLDAGAYVVTVTDANNCVASGSATISDDLSYIANLGNDLTATLGDYIDLQVVSNIPINEIKDYTWSGMTDFTLCTDCDEYSFQPTGNDCHIVVVRSIKGCIATDTVCYELAAKRQVYVPNAFSPNDDGVNDRFTVYSDASVAQVGQFSVFNRWGEQVYQAQDIQPNDESAGWDGTVKGKFLYSEVYVWLAEIEFIDGVKQTFRGDVTVLR